MKPKIIIDANIPYIRGVFDKVAEVEYLVAKEITPQKVKTADALIIRTRTRCNADLLNDSKVKFIATATIGIDHIDTAYCDAHNIKWTNAPGCNAESVAQWVGSALAVWADKHKMSLKGKTIGIVGHGHVGKRVERLARQLGMRVLLNDPPLADSFSHENNITSHGMHGRHGTQLASLVASNHELYVDLETIVRLCDVITFHTPLTREGEFPTYHLFDAQCIMHNAQSDRPLTPAGSSPNLGEHSLETVRFDGSPNLEEELNTQFANKIPRLIINAARGGIIDEQALLSTLNSQLSTDIAIDCWEGEPETNSELREKALITTPHIAGYSADGKYNASQQVIKAVAEFFDLQPEEIDGLPPQTTTSATDDELGKQLLDNYNILADSDALKAEPHKFEYFRNNYPTRRELRVES